MKSYAPPTAHGGCEGGEGGEGGGGEGGGDEGGGGVGIDGGDCDGMFDSRPDICRAGCCSVLAMSPQSDVVGLARIYNLHSLALG